MVPKIEFLVPMYVQLIQYACSSTCIYDVYFFWNIRLNVMKVISMVCVFQVKHLNDVMKILFDVIVLDC